MKNKLIITVFAIWHLALSSFASLYPKALAVHPTENLMVIGHESGNLIILEKTTYKHIKTLKILAEIKSISFSKDGDHFWVFGNDADHDESLIQLNSSTWEKTTEIACEEISFSAAGNKLAYKKDYFSKELKLIDLTTAEVVGGVKISFTDEQTNADHFQFTQDGKNLILIEQVYGDKPCEILIFPGEGFVSQPLKSVLSRSTISKGFGTGSCSFNDEFVLVGWSQTIKTGADSVQVIERNGDYCYTFCASPDGKHFFIGTSYGQASRYEFSTLRKTEVQIEEMNGVTGNIRGICTTDGKVYHFITEDYIAGTFSSEGFVLKQNFISMNVNVVLDDYETKEIETIKEACKANGLDVIIPEEYNEENPTVIATNLSMSDAYKLIEKMYDADVYCAVAIIE